jgi:hypothetical protein
VVAVVVAVAILGILVWFFAIRDDGDEESGGSDRDTDQTDDDSDTTDDDSDTTDDDSDTTDDDSDTTDDDSDQGEEGTRTDELGTDEVNDYEVEVDDGDTLVVTVIGLPEGSGDFDPVVEVFDADGASVAQNDDFDALDADLPQSTDSYLEVDVDDGGTWIVSVEEFFGFEGEYEITIDVR